MASSWSARVGFDPYKNFKFRVKWDGRYVAGVSKVSSLKRTTEVVEHRERRRSRAQHRSPGGAPEYEAITLERGVTHDAGIRGLGGEGVGTSAAGSAAKCRWPISARTSIIEFYNEAGQLVIATTYLSLLGLGVSGAPGPGRQRQRRCRFSTSSWKTRAGSATRARPSQRNRVLTSLRQRNAGKA